MSTRTYSVAWYIDAALIEASDGDKSWWDGEFLPGAKVPVAGIFRCIGCCREIALARNGNLPPGGHHQHEEKARPIAWRLIVRANTSGHATMRAIGGCEAAASRRHGGETVPT